MSHECFLLSRALAKGASYELVAFLDFLTAGADPSSIFLFLLPLGRPLFFFSGAGAISPPAATSTGAATSLLPTLLPWLCLRCGDSVECLSQSAKVGVMDVSAREGIAGVAGVAAEAGGLAAASLFGRGPLFFFSLLS